MPKTKIVFVIVILFFSSPDSVYSQLVKEKFQKNIFNDRFDEDKGNWKSISTSENLFLIQDGEYLLRRKNSFSGYSIFPTWKNTATAFSVRASVKLEDSKNDEASVGLIFMAQEDGSGAFVFEFNPKSQYRLKQLVGVNYKLLTGDTKTNGWIDSDALNSVGQFNLIEVRSAKRNYDVFINEKYLLSFTEIAYKSGDVGFALGAASKAKVDFIQVNESGEDNINSQPSNSGSGMESNPVKTGETGSTSDVILKLVDQVSSLTIENKYLRDSLVLVKKQLRAANKTINAAKAVQKTNPDSLSTPGKQ